MARHYLLILTIFLCLAATESSGQQLQIDRGVRTAGLWCFPLVTDSLKYVYLPNQAHLALDDNHDPQFSLVRYVINMPAESNAAATITSAGGGAILHFLVLYDTPEETIAEAEAALREKFDNDEISIRGPIVFESGRYALVSSILNPADGSQERNLLAMGEAPVLEGSRIALSFEMDPQASTLLLESFKMATPDISLVFDMSFAGLTDAYEAELEIDWSEVKKSQAFEAGGSVYFVSAEVEFGFDELMRNNSIRLRSSGSDDAMEALLTTVYDKLLELMFRPVEPERVPEDQRGDLLDAFTALLDPKSGPLSSSKTTGFGLHAGYQLKEMKSEGKSVLFFNSRSLVKRHHYITFNIGDLYAHYGDDPRFFRTAVLDDPDFQQREIYVGVDGALVREFNRLINSVTVTLRKNHQGGEQTIQEVVVNRQTFSDSIGPLRMVYGSKADTNRLNWLNYEYRTSWQFGSFRVAGLSRRIGQSSPPP